jgi:DNA processing protein
VGGVSSSGGAVTEDVLLARAYLSRVAEASCVPLWGLVEQVGPVSAAAAIRDGSAPEKVLAATAARRDAHPEDDLEAAARLGLRLLTPEDGEWPHASFAALHGLAQQRWRAWNGGETRPQDSGEPLPPLALWVRGPVQLSLVTWRSVAVVGARAASDYGERVAKQLAYDLAGRGVTVVSGGAYGIDAAAHRGALSAGGVTLLVSAAGLDRPYPPGNAPLYERVADSGLLVSESPPGCAPHRHRFLMRNRLIAALATGVVIVEAARRSGATNTAGHARRQSRTVMAVPGSVHSAMSVGCHEEIRRFGAVLVGGVDDVLEAVGAVGESLERPAPACDDARGALDRLDATVRQVFDGLPARNWSTVSQIAVRAGLSALEVVRGLPALELAGLIESSDRGYRITPAMRPGSAR